MLVEFPGPLQDRLDRRSQLRGAGFVETFLEGSGLFPDAAYAGDRVVNRRQPRRQPIEHLVLFLQIGLGNVLEPRVREDFEGPAV